MDKQARCFFEAYPLEKLLKTIPTGLFLVNNAREIVYWNDEAERITGYAASEAVGKHCSFLKGIPCDKYCGLYEVAATKPISGIGCSVVHHDGHRIELTKNIDLLYDNGGNALGGIEAFVDISRLKELQHNLKNKVADRTAELEQERRNLSAVLDGMTDLAYICNEDFELIFMNRAMRELYGEVGNQKCYEALHGLPHTCAGCPLPEVKQGKIVHQERLLPLTGCTYEIIHSPLYQADGQYHKLGVCRDITERIRNETALKRANADLDAFVSTVSHDLRSPLTPLIGFSEFLLEQYAPQLDETAADCLREIKKAGNKMQVLLEDLSILARVGQFPRPESPVALRLVLEDVRQELAVQILRHKARIKITGLPEVRVPESLLADLLRNLLLNALNYAVDQNPLIEIEGRKLSDRVQLLVIDHGPGVKLEERERIFEPFQRGTAAEKTSGSGVGLATVRKIARLYQGQVRVEETLGGGATFIIDFFDEVPK